MRAELAKLLVLTSLACLSQPLAAQEAAAAADPGWPRVFERGGNRLTVHQPQIDAWAGYTNLLFRCAVSVKAGDKPERFGVAEMDAVTRVDQADRSVAMSVKRRELRFPNVPEAEERALRALVDELRPVAAVTALSLDRLIACLDPDDQPQQKAVALNLAPPAIFFSSKPAILVMFLGPPQFKPVAKGRTDLMFAINTNWDLFFDTAAQRYYLLDGDSWLVAADVKGPWAAAPAPARLATLPADANWEEVRKRLAAPAETAPAVFVSDKPAELILTDGDPKFTPVSGTRLIRVANTESVLFLHSGDSKYYFLAAGRWFRAGQLTGPWSAASADLPADFARIPDDDPAAYVKASVPGTDEARDAVLLASVPATTTVPAGGTNTALQVTYSGEPQFRRIEKTAVNAAVNTASAVFQVEGRYYCCEQGIWYSSDAAAGPWSLCAKVPDAIYTIPPGSPQHNVTYVTVQTVTQTNIVYAQTAGYCGEYVDDACGLLMFGAGVWLASEWLDDHDHWHCYYPAPVYYSYGCGAVYHYGYGGYYAGHAAYGPYGGVRYGTAYNPHTGTYTRGATAYGPNGSASVRQAYNPYTGGYAQAGRVDTAAGSAGRFYAERGGDAVWGGARSGERGSAGAIRTSEGGGMVAWDTQRGQGAVAKDSSGNIYAGKDGTVYRRDSNGNWSQNSGSGWQSVAQPSPTASRTAAGQRPSATAPSAVQRPATTTSSAMQRPTATTRPSVPLETRQSVSYQSASRDRGNVQSQRVQSFRSSGSSFSSSRSFSGGSRGFSGGRGGGRGGRR